MSNLQSESAVELREGRARLQPQSLLRGVFYNPKMGINRDLAVLFASSHCWSTPSVRVCDPMTGSGVRVVRYLLEAPTVAHVVAGDREPISAQMAQQMLLLNHVESRATVVQGEAQKLLFQHETDRFDLIDLDPFGSPAPFFESALRATSNDGVIAATATDMGPLSGARPTACIRKYGISPVRTEFEKEMAIRTLASCISATACKLELGIEIAFSHATDHYARLYGVVNKGRRAANRTLANLQYLTYCKQCLFRSEGKSISSLQNNCLNCGAPAQSGGPFWLGALWDRRTVDEMVGRAANLSTSRVAEVQKILSRIQEETDAPKFYYTTDSMASEYNVKPPSLMSLIALLISNGFKATRTHFSPTGFRTNAPLKVIADSFRAIAKKSNA